MATTTPLAERTRRLVAASERTQLDPFEEVDWSVPIDDRAFHLPPEHLPLFGTPQWEAMNESDRRAYSRHECAALCSAGIWFENILMQLVLSHLYSLRADDSSHRYLLIETADECRHSAMFGEYVRRAGTPAYLPGMHQQLGGRAMMALSGKAEGYIAILAAEELLDATNRATVHDDRVHPISRQMAKLHVAEEARHMSFARAWLADRWSQLGPIARVRAAVQAPMWVAGIAEALVNPAVYRELGIAQGWVAARTNPLHRQRVATDLGRLTEFLTDLGAITPLTRPAWRIAGLLAD